MILASGYRQVCYYWVPHLLRDEHSSARINAVSQLLETHAIMLLMVMITYLWQKHVIAVCHIPKEEEGQKSAFGQSA
jgi:hypothetical protein